jgi:misacylated tRNA(Ala) deacylase
MEQWSSQVLTELLYLNDHYLKEFDAVIVSSPSNTTLILDRTAIYPRGGGQPSDHGSLVLEGSGLKLGVVESSKGPEGVVHELSTAIPDPVSKGLPGKRVHAIIDWELRYKHMRHHTALHILSGVVFHKYAARITGGQIYADRARLDLSLSDLSKERRSEMESEMNRIVSENLNVVTRWLSAEEALQKPELYRLNPGLLPQGQEKLRIVEIVGFDAQLDGGTHVAKTGEIGTISISKWENKGKDNKRIEIVLAS